MVMVQRDYRPETCQHKTLLSHYSFKKGNGFLFPIIYFEISLLILDFLSPVFRKILILNPVLP